MGDLAEPSGVGRETLESREKHVKKDTSVGQCPVQDAGSWASRRITCIVHCMAHETD